MKFSEFPYERVKLDRVTEEGKEIIRAAAQAKSGEEQYELHEKFNRLQEHVRRSLPELAQHKVSPATNLSQGLHLIS